VAQSTLSEGIENLDPGNNKKAIFDAISKKIIPHV
jgi:hypothetical protein